MLKKKFSQVLLLLPFSFILAGCSLTRVTEQEHATEVNALNFVGMSLEAARFKATGQGFECSPGPTLNSVQMEDGIHRWQQTECSKASMEIFCPQTRSIVLNVDPDSQKVVAVGKYITSHTCF